MIKQVNYADTYHMTCDKCGKEMNWDGDTRTATISEKKLNITEKWRCPVCNRQILFRKEYMWSKSEIMTVR